MNEDAILLRRFAEDQTQQAFTELVQRHLAMVYGTALRRVGGDVHLAQDVSQMVFISLARKASSLRNHASLAGWLYVSTHRATSEIVRGEQRRKARETSAHSMNVANVSDEPPIDPVALRPVVDDALVELNAADREAVVLRYFSQRSFAEIAGSLRITEEAARKRVERAVEKLHATLSRRGITSTAAALGSTLTAAGMTVAPATLGSQIATLALAQGALAPGVALATTLTSALLPAAAMAAVLTALWTVVPQQRANAEMASAITGLEQERAARADMQSEIDRLARALALARTAPPVPPMSPTRTVAAPTLAPATPNTAAAPKEIQVTTEGTILWEGEGVTLDEFLARIVRYQTEGGSAGSPILVKGNGVKFAQLNWVLVEAGKAGVTSLVVESDSEPDPRIVADWF